ncbi:hypothetical protein ILUMI_22401 [Ignelater luminosus]|uniref:Uncharacterized protein n=1 Tax=Ignelater luminosus TaxID=2038154 RepID=A0A8K0G2U8_IGNLU|nr:hypothetical protein ILUMI_22401 [Ignelater luminosus]
MKCPDSKKIEIGTPKDVMNEIKNGIDPNKAELRDKKRHTYADDTVLLEVTDEDKSARVSSRNERIPQIPVTIFGKIVSYSNTAKYLRMTLDAKLQWTKRIKQKHQKLVVSNKYKQVLKPVGTYHALRKQNLNFGTCAIHDDIHRDLQIEPIEDEIRRM